MVFAMSNPDPEVKPEEAMEHVRIMATGRSDYPNQINNVLAFPGIFRGALDVRARQITEKMKLAAARAIADAVPAERLRETSSSRRPSIGRSRRPSPPRWPRGRSRAHRPQRSRRLRSTWRRQRLGGGAGGPVTPALTPKS